MRQVFQCSKHLILVLAAAGSVAGLAAPVAAAATNDTGVTYTSGQCDALFTQYMNTFNEALSDYSAGNFGMYTNDVGQMNNYRKEAADNGCAWAQAAPLPKVTIRVVGGSTGLTAVAK